MPIYAYRAISPDDACDCCGSEFEVLQKLTDPELTHCPECGQAVVQIISAPNLQSGDANLLDSKNVGKHGFTQYKRAGDGVYEKSAGKGPRYISDDGK